jgi:ketosteroid isomerase-like protein
MADAEYQTEQELIRLEHEWVEAIAQCDAATLNRLIADDFFIAGWLPNGQLGDKQTYVEDCLRVVDVLEPAYSFDSWRIKEYGDVVIVNSVFECHAVVAGREWGGIFLLTDVWIKEDGRWRAATRHSSPVLTA